MPKRKRSKRMSDEQWSRLLDIRCRSKHGRHVTDEEHDFCNQMYNEFQEDYCAMESRVYNMTAADIGSAKRVPETTRPKK